MTSARVVLVGLVVGWAVAVPRAGHSACNLIPGATRTFAGQLGATNRPFSAPGEPVEIAVRSCDTSSPGFEPTGPEHVVSIAIKPAAGGPGKLVVVASDCNAVDTGSCPGAVCKQVLPVLLEIILRDGNRQLRFPFPDTDAEELPDGDGLTLSGPAAIAVTKVGDPLPCGLATTSCAAQSNVRACVDTLFFDDGGCGQAFAHPAFPTFTALPRVNDYQADCFDKSPPCTASAPNVRFAVDAAGNLLLPVNWSGVLAQTAAPVPRELTIHVQPPLPVAAIPSQAFLASYTPEGGLLPPIFEPQIAPAAAPNTLKFFGSSDAPYSVLRVARRRGVCTGGPHLGEPCAGVEHCVGAPCDLACVGGANDGNPCTNASACPSGGCGALFDVAAAAATSGMVVSRLGPGICQATPHADCTTNADCPGNPCVNYAFESGAAHDLNGVVATSESFGFVISEKIEAGSLNGDGDPTQSDDVVVMRDRETGIIQPIGNNLTCGINQNPEPPGRAIVGLSVPPFLFQAVAGEGDVLAFLESEPEENQCDANDDGDRLDAILRVFRLGPTELTAGTNRAADAGLHINRRSLAVSNGRVFFRTPERTAAVATSRWASVTPGGAGGNDASIFLGSGQKLSADGHYLVFSSIAGNLVANPQPAGIRAVFRRDLVTGTTEPVDVDPGGGPVGYGGWEGISGDGNYVTFLSAFGGILPGANAFSQVYLRDMAGTATEYVSVDDNETIGNGNSEDSFVTPGGRWVVFSSAATNLAAPCTNGMRQIFLRDRQTGTTECLSLGVGGAQGDGNSDQPSISDDGTIVAFQSVANNLVADDVNPSMGLPDIFVRNRTTGVTTLVSRDTAGGQVLGFQSLPRLSADGRSVAFEGTAPGCTGGSCVYVKDRVSGVLEQVTVDSEGNPIVSSAGIGDISGDGRYVAFYSNGALTLADTNGQYDIFLRDRLAGITERIGLGDGGIEGDDRSYLPWISDDGRVVTFVSWASTLDAGDVVATCNTHGISECVGGANAGAACIVASECPGGSCDPQLDQNCPDVFVHSTAADDRCGDAVLDLGEDCDPPGAPAGACGGQNCSLTCHCADNAADLTQDGTLDQTVLQVLDARIGFGAAVATLCPADDVVVSGGTAAFLRAEADGNAPGCPSVGASLNAADADTTDTVVHLSTLGAPAQNLGRAATALSLDATCSTAGTACSADQDCPGVETCRPPYLAALVSEPGEGGSILNGDGDGLDTVLNVYRLTGSPGWQPIAAVQAADAVDMKGDLAVFTTPEAAQSGAILNGDGDALDRVLRLYDAATATLVDLQIAAEDFVVGTPALIDCGAGPELHQVVAFRTREAAQGAGSLNGDGDTLDSALYVIDYDVNAHAGTLIDKQVAVTPCPLEACDPRFPYRVAGKRVKFLTREPEQGGTDLNGDGDATDLILQTIDVCTGALTPIAAVDESADDSPALIGNDPTHDIAQDDSSVVVTSGGRCMQGGTLLLVPATCVTDDDCPIGAVCTATRVVVATPVEDLDFDGVIDELDNCPTLFNDSQADLDVDGVGDACDTATACAKIPRTDCHVPALANKSQLQLKDKVGSEKDTLQWKWQKGAATDLAELGNPLTTHAYALCLYDESGTSPELIFEATAPAGGVCGTAPCWKASGSTGFAYKNKAATPQGLTQIQVKAGLAGKAKAGVKGKGTPLLLPRLPLTPPIRVQLQGANGECWETLHSNAGVTKNDGAQFSAKDP